MVAIVAGVVGRGQGMYRPRVSGMLGVSGVARVLGLAGMLGVSGVARVLGLAGMLGLARMLGLPVIAGALGTVPLVPGITVYGGRQLVAA